MEQGPTSRAALADWYSDPSHHHQLRYWDGAAWTKNVADDGHTSADAPPEGAAPPVLAPATEGAEVLVMAIPRISDVKWGGSATLYLTDRRLVVEQILTTGAVVGSTLGAGVGGMMAARKHAETRHAQQQAPGHQDQAATQTVADPGAQLDQILATSPKSYGIDYAQITKLTLRRKAMPIGHSRCKIRSAHHNVTLAFKRDLFDQVAQVLTQALPGRVTVK